MDIECKDLRFSGIAKGLLAALRRKELTYADFMKECAYWVVKDGFDEILPLAYPNAPRTAAFNEYASLPLERQQKLDPSFFARNYEINEYYKQRAHVYFMNKSNLEWLQEIKKYIPAGDFSRHEKLDQRIREFQAWINDGADIVEKAKLAFAGREID